MKNPKAHKTAAFISLAVIGAFLLGIFHMGLDDKIWNILPWRWLLIGATGYAAYVFNKFLNF